MSGNQDAKDAAARRKEDRRARRAAGRTGGGRRKRKNWKGMGNPQHHPGENPNGQGGK